MAELGRCFETISLGHDQYQTTIGIKPINFYNGHAWEREVVDFVSSGISLRPHMVGASQLMVSVADDGDLRAHPTREDSRYFEFGAPLIKVAGDWVRPGFGDRTRIGNRISWTTDYENAYLVHAGHYLKWGVLLKNNFDRWSQFAMPVGLTGLTRTGGQLYADGVPVMHLRAPVVYDYDNEEDVRQIEHQFVQQDGQWYVLFTLPDLTGMSKPLIDPTLELQPDAAGKDTRIEDGGVANNNYGVSGDMSADTSPQEKAMLEFDVSSIPVSSTVSTSTLTLKISNTGDDPNLHKGLVEWFEGEKNGAAPGATDGSTWNHRNANTGGQVAWSGGAGGVAGTEYETIATATIVASATVAVNVTGLASDVQDWVTTPSNNCGWWIIPTGADSVSINTSDNATDYNRPKLVIVYTDRFINISEENTDNWKRGVKIYP